jgi:hypothetical protein
MSTITTWFNEYRKRPYGSGATMTDYGLTAILAVLVLYIVMKIFKQVRG